MLNNTKFAKLLSKYKITTLDISKGTGIPVDRLRAWNFGKGIPTEQEYGLVRDFLEGKTIVPEKKTAEPVYVEADGKKSAKETVKTEKNTEIKPAGTGNGAAPDKIPATEPEENPGTVAETAEPARKPKKKSTGTGRRAAVLKKYGIPENSTEEEIPEMLIKNASEKIGTFMTDILRDIVCVSSSRAQEPSPKLKKLYEAAENASDEAIDMAVKILQRI